jgi:aminoglycoside phosphotransferase (APT) family kinase protein
LTEVGRLLASGRDSDILEYGPGRVLRRSRNGRVIEAEAEVMRYAAERGYPVPRVDEVRGGGTEIVMERVDGPLLMDMIGRRPQTVRRSAALLADLHDQLHEITAPPGLRRVDATGDRLLHLDLHPLNVIMARRGPVVIDWSNAATGDPLTDVGCTYVLLTCPRAPVPRPLRLVLRPLRAAMAHSFASRYPADELGARTAFAAELKMLDPHLAPDEVDACRRLARRLRMP